MSTVDFDSAVLQRSHVLPVVVDFWAPWCGPCRTLGPLIERLASESAGRWELVKINTEEQPELAAQHNILSIPAVKMFHRGRPVAEFVGALPEDSVVRWLDENLPDERITRLESIMARWGTPDQDRARQDLEGFIEEHPDLPLARLRLAQFIVAERPDRARDAILSAGAGQDLEELAGDLSALADLMQVSDAPSRVAPHLDAARAALRGHDMDGALERLVELAMMDKSFGDQLARRAAVALFRLLGQNHELTRKHQRGLSMALHS